MSAISKLFEAMSAVMLRETGHFEVNEGAAAPETKAVPERMISRDRKSVSGRPTFSSASHGDRSRQADSVIGLMK